MATAFLVDGDGIDSSISSNEDFEESNPQETHNLLKEDVFGDLKKLFQATKFDDANIGHTSLKPDAKPNLFTPILKLGCAMV